jgi:acyl-CoA synthetase (AMP-forming)/AMP-acid ligase II
VVAVVVARPGSELGAQDVIAYCRERLAAYKYPREIRFMGELPKGPSGKILKSALRDGVLQVLPCAVRRRWRAPLPKVRPGTRIPSSNHSST